MKRHVTPTELHLYGFDGVLYDPPAPPSGTKNPATWRANVASLKEVGPPGFDPRWNLWVVQQARRSCGRPDVVALLITERLKLRPLEVRMGAILKGADLIFDEVYYRSPLHKAETEIRLVLLLKKLFLKYPTAAKVSLCAQGRDQSPILGALRKEAERCGRVLISKRY
jgi:hypothetical protein